MEINTKQDSGITVISPVGRIDTSTAKNFEEGIQKIISNSSSVIISFASVDYISSAGLRVILMTGKKIASNKGLLALTDMPIKIYEVFKMSGFDKILKIYPTFAEAKPYFEVH